jgi:hypothetical protein
LVYETRQIFSFLTKHDIRLSITHVPGVENVTADALSRMDLVGDYSLKPDYFERGIEALGVNPTLDVFATVMNRKCENFLALPGRAAKGAVALDAMRYDWSGQAVYAFPPVQMIPRVLQKVLRENLDSVVMVVPEWPSRPWWNLLQEQVVRQVRLGLSEEVLEPGPSLRVARSKLPPGHMIMAVLSSTR